MGNAKLFTDRSIPDLPVVAIMVSFKVFGHLVKNYKEYTQK